MRHMGCGSPPPRADQKSPALEAELAHGKGWFEIQDEGSQLASLLSGAKAGDQILDFCAGAGGKTLALADMTENKGQIHAYDADKHRLRPIVERLKRAGVRNVQTYSAGDITALAPLQAAMDIVFVDSPCTGTGTWRRHPDAKWRLTEKKLAERCRQQKEVLHQAAPYVQPGGRLVYVTCSLLQEENERQVNAFLQTHEDFSPVPIGDVGLDVLSCKTPLSADFSDTHLLLSPARHGSDGFFISALIRK